MSIFVKKYIEHAVLINLARRKDRLSAFFSQSQIADFPFPMPKLFCAIDGWAAPLPNGWKSGSGSRGCQQSHLAVLGEAIRNKVDSLLILEDDACLATNFASSIAKFMADVPSNWDCLMLGGQHRNGSPIFVSPNIVRCLNCQRTHAYIVRGKSMAMLYSLYDSMTTGHIDHLAGRWQPDWHVYAPNPFLIGQAAGKSDITCRTDTVRFWSNTKGNYQYPSKTKHRHFTLANTQDHASKTTNNPANLATTH
jgi:hypothetical protein